MRLDAIFMENTLTLIQVITAVFLIITILLQQRGSGMGGAFGGGSEVYSAKRGAEKGIFNITIVLSVIFIGLGLARLFI